MREARPITLLDQHGRSVNGRWKIMDIFNLRLEPSTGAARSETTLSILLFFLPVPCAAPRRRLFLQQSRNFELVLAGINLKFHIHTSREGGRGRGRRRHITRVFQKVLGDRKCHGVRTPTRVGIACVGATFVERRTEARARMCVCVCARV